MSGSTSLPTVMTASGLQPQTPASLLSQLLTSVQAQAPGYTAVLPGSLIEDVSSTAVAGIALCDSARVELVNSMTPYGANAFILTQLGQQFGIPQGQGSNASVYVVFGGISGFAIPQGFLVSDGTYQYAVQDASVINSTGQSNPVFCVATTEGTWAIPANSVNQLATSVPTSTPLSANNPSAGTPATSAVTEQAYRAQVLLAWQATAVGTIPYLKTLLQNLPGVAQRLIAVKVIAGQGYEIICGGGDPYDVANAIYTAQFDLDRVIGSTMTVTNVTQANPGQVTTELTHGYTTGQVVYFQGIQGMTELNTGTYTATVVDEYNFTIGVNTTSYTAFTEGGEVLPNLRNITASILDYPDQYNITFVNPPQQTVNIGLTWNTNLPSFTSGPAVDQLAQVALVNYVNSIPVGAPLNLFELQSVVQQAVVLIIPTPALTRMVFTVEINGVAQTPTTGTGLINGDPESFFFASSTTVLVSQG